MDEKKKNKFFIEFNRKDCIGCGSCSIINEKYFKMIDDSSGKASLVGSKKEEDKFVLGSKEEPLTENYNQGIEAVEGCPVQCIKVIKVDD
jgi:ferredoxin